MSLLLLALEVCLWTHNSALDVEGAGGGVPGELVCREAFPTEPVGFWPLPGYGFDMEAVESAQARFKESYFKDTEGTWYHGD